MSGENTFYGTGLGGTASTTTVSTRTRDGKATATTTVIDASGAAGDFNGTQEALAALLELLGAASSKGSTGGTGVPAPEIDAPQAGLSPEAYAPYLSDLMGRVYDNQLRTATEGMKDIQKKADDRNAAAKKKLDEWIQKSKAADSHGGLAKAFGWLKKIGGPVAIALATILSVAVTVGSLGTLTAPAIAFMALVIGLSAWTMAQQVASAAGHPLPSLSGEMAGAMRNLLLHAGLSQDDADHFGQVLAGGMAVLVPALMFADPGFAGQLGAGIVHAAGGSDMQAGIAQGVLTAAAGIATSIAIAFAAPASAGQALSSTASNLKTAGRLTQAAASMTDGVGSMGKGAVDIQKAKDEHAVAMVTADRREIAAQLALLQQAMDGQRQTIEGAQDAIQQSVRVFMDLIGQQGQSNHYILQRVAHA